MNEYLPLTEALAHLDPENDSHWTSDGLPRMDAIVELTGDVTIKRPDVNKIDHELTREVALERAQRASEASMFEAELEEDTDVVASDEPSEPTDAAPQALPDTEGVEIVDVLSMDRSVVLQDYKLTILAREAMDEKLLGLAREREALKAMIGGVNRDIEILKRAESIHLNRDPSLRQQSPIKAYLDSQRIARAERASRARVFIESGTTAEAVAEQLAGSSKLDRALGAGKPGWGSKRPAVRTPR